MNANDMLCYARINKIEILNTKKRKSTNRQADYFENTYVVKIYIDRIHKLLTREWIQKLHEALSDCK